MKIAARLHLYDTEGPDPWDDSWGLQLPLHHVICREENGTPHSVGDLEWPWSAYTKGRTKAVLHFYYWHRKTGRATLNKLDVSAERSARIRELQFLMTRQLFYGVETAPKTLQDKLYTLKFLARFAEARSCSLRHVLSEASLLDACGASIPSFYVKQWMAWLNLFRQLDPSTQLGFTLARPKQWSKLESRAAEVRNKLRQYPPLPTRIYGSLINKLSAEIADIEAHADQLLTALREAFVEHAQFKELESRHSMSVGPALIQKHGLESYLTRRGFNLTNRALATLSGAVTEVFLICKLQIHVFSGMRHDEARTLPFHCMVTKKAQHGRSHSLLAGVTTKFNKGRCLRTHWVTTDQEGFRAVRLARRFAAVIYDFLGVTPSEVETEKDNFPLFPATRYLPWHTKGNEKSAQINAAGIKLLRAKDALFTRLVPVIEEQDIAELEEIDPFRAWRSETDFEIGKHWPLSTHQLRRSLAVYANASGLVRLSSLRRQLQHITREMSLYYGRGSTFCKNFIANDLDGYKKHIALEWQDSEDEAMMLTFTRDVLNSKEAMFGGAGKFYQRQKERGDVMTRRDVESRMKKGLLSYASGPLGGCTKTGGCDKRKGLAIVDISCATDVCKNLVGKHSKILRIIQLKRASMNHNHEDSIESAMDREELNDLERVEQEWRPPSTAPTVHVGGEHD
jgi:hypothetical protein